MMFPLRFPLAEGFVASPQAKTFDSDIRVLVAAVPAPPDAYWSPRAVHTSKDSSFDAHLEFYHPVHFLFKWPFFLQAQLFQ
jgi:hypothetical protein